MLKTLASRLYGRFCSTYNSPFMIIAIFLEAKWCLYKLLTFFLIRWCIIHSTALNCMQLSVLHKLMELDRKILIVCRYCHPQGSVLEPLLFALVFNDLFFFNLELITLECLRMMLAAFCRKSMNVLIDWFSANHFA